MDSLFGLKFELIINLKPARTFGINVQPMLIAQVNQVIE
jgi:hypothetical protein